MKKNDFEEKTINQNIISKDNLKNPEKKKNEKKFVDYMFKNMQNKK